MNPPFVAAWTNRFTSGATGRWLISHVVAPLHRQTYPLHRGWLPFTPARILLLTATGRRTGLARTTPVFYLRDGAAYVVCNVRPPGERANPWVLNVRAAGAAVIEAGRERMPVSARQASPEEFERLWPALVAIWPAYADSRAAGGAATVFILTPRGHE